MMLLLVDANSVAARSFYGVHRVPGMAFQERDFIRAFLSSLIKSMDAVSQGNGRAILCMDDEKSWRTDILPEYKSSRKEAKKKVPWAEYCECLLEVCAGLRESTPLAVVRRPGYEADDLIAYFAKTIDRVIIISSDTDMLQLHNPKLSIYRPDKMAFAFPEPDAAGFLQVLTCCGDSTDDVPSIVPKYEGKPKFRFGEKTVLSMLDPAGLCGLSLDLWKKLSDKDSNQFKLDWERNRLLVDLSLSPVFKESIVPVYGKYDPDAVLKFLGSRININGPSGERACRLMEQYGGEAGFVC